MLHTWALTSLPIFQNCHSRYRRTRIIEHDSCICHIRHLGFTKIIISIAGSSRELLIGYPDFLRNTQDRSQQRKSISNLCMLDYAMIKRLMLGSAFLRKENNFQLIISNIDATLATVVHQKALKSFSYQRISLYQIFSQYSKPEVSIHLLDWDQLLRFRCFYSDSRKYIRVSAFPMQQTVNA